MDPDPSRVATARDFGRELARARIRAGLTVRRLSAVSQVPNGTVSGYLTGEHLPPPMHLGPLRRILAACGESDPRLLAAWEDAVRRARRTPGRRPGDSRSPYRGLSSFEVEDADLFKGREALTGQVLDQLRHAVTAGRRLLFVIGPSGAGKSSLLRAGVVPALARAGHAVTVIVPGARPVEALGDWTATAESVLVVDQFEELFARDVPVLDRQRFVAALDSSGVVILGMRADFYASALEYPVLAAALQNGQVVVGPLSAQELRAVIIEPARQLGIDVDDGLVEVIVRDLASPIGANEGVAHDAGALPLLSHALLVAWQHSRSGRLTVADYLTAGGVEGSIAQVADAAYAGLTAQQRTVARNVFLRLVHTGEEGWDTRRRMGLGEIRYGTGADPDDVQAVLDRFVLARMVTVDGAGVQITHEALLRAWPRLRAWLDTDRDWLRLHRRLTTAAADWEESGRDPDRLYHSGMLQAMREWLDVRGYRSTLNALEAEFVETSARARALEEARERRRTRRRYSVVALLTALTVIAASSAAFSGKLLTNRARDRAQALSRYVADEANRLRDHDVSLSMQLALEAYRIWPTPEARASLIDSTAVLAAPRLRSPNGPATALAAGDGGRILAAGTNTGAVELWSTRPRPDYANPTQVRTGARGQIRTLAFAPGGTLLAGGSSDGEVYLWELPTTTRPAVISGCASVVSIAFSGDGRTLAEACGDGAVRLWLITPGRRAIPGGHLASATTRAPIVSVDFSALGPVLAIANADGTIRLYSTADPAHPVLLSTVSTAPSGAFGAVISPDGHTLAAAAGEGHSVELWDIRDPAQPRPVRAHLTGPASWVNSVTFSPDGRTIAAGSSDGLLWLYDTTTHHVIQTLPHPRPVGPVVYIGPDTVATLADDGTIRTWQPPGPEITGATDTIFALSYDASGDRLVVGPGADDNTITVWNTSSTQQPRRLGAPITNPLTTDKFSGTGALTPDGRTLVVGGNHGATQLFDVSDPAAPKPVGSPLPAAGSLIEAVTISHHGNLVATADDDGTVPLYDIRDPRHPTLLAVLPPTTPDTYTYQAIFSPDDHLLAVADRDHHCYLWDITDPAHPTRLAALGGFTDAVYTAAFTTDTHLLAVGSADGTVRLWDITRPDRPTALEHVLTGPIGYIYSVAYDPARHALAVAGSTDGSIRLWDLSDPHNITERATLTGPANGLLIVAFSPDGHTLVAGGHDHTVRLWNIDEAADAAWICANTGQPVTRQEWAQYVPNRDYEPPC